jgi:hypothetical protein
VELQEYNETALGDTLLAEYLRPRWQFKEDAKKNNKSCGCKLLPKNAKRDTKLHNWFHPLLFSQIDAATRRTSKPWSPREIVKALHKSNLKDFHALTEQVIGRCIACDANNEWLSRWSDAVLRSVERGKGNVPGGHSTRCGVLIRITSL